MQCRACWLHGGRFLSDVPVSLYVCLPLCVCVCVLLFSHSLSLNFIRLMLVHWPAVPWLCQRAHSETHNKIKRKEEKKNNKTSGLNKKTEKQKFSKEIKKERDRTREKERRCDSPLLLSLLSGRAQRIALDGQLLFCFPRVSTELFFFSLSIFLVPYSLF